MPDIHPLQGAVFIDKQKEELGLGGGVVCPVLHLLSAWLPSGMCLVSSAPHTHTSHARVPSKAIK